jgi:L-aminopeptidase/D-esterase-like protein
MAGKAAGTVGVTVGHWTHEEARTGCTAVLFEAPVLTAVEIRGGAPATRETELFGSGRLVRRADAIVLAGGSAFGLEAAEGAVRFLADHDRGFPTPAGPVPIVTAAGIYDLGVGHPLAPDAAAGQAACQAAVPLPAVARGQVGVGTGATTGKIAGAARAARGGVGLGQVHWSGGGVTALVVVNAFGDVVDPISGQRLTEPARGLIDRRAEIVAGTATRPGIATATTIAVVLVEAPCDHDSLVRCAISAHDGFARAVRPCHTPFDGDMVFAIALAEGSPAPFDTMRLAVASELAVEAAIVDAVTA